jgi:hypothetical protein
VRQHPQIANGPSTSSTPSRSSSSFLRRASAERDGSPRARAVQYFGGMRRSLACLGTIAVVACGVSLALVACGASIGPGEGDAGRVDASRDAGADRDAAKGDGGEAGLTCYASTDCEGGTCSYAKTVCTGHDCTTSPACPGTCAPYAVKGGFCLAPGPPTCPPNSGLTCDPFSHRCVPSGSEKLPVVDGGASCGLGVANCGPGFFCDAPVFPDDGVCTPLIQDGGACDPLIPGSCTSGLLCVGDDGGICRPPWPAGGACVAAGDGTGTSGCDQGALCVDGGCLPLPSTGPCLEGQCDSDASYCSSTNKCVPFAPNGAACTSESQCASGLCASNTHKCVAELPLGAECMGPYDCTKDLCAGDMPGCQSGICDMTGHCAKSMCAR